ncbi:MAG: helix-turn-helix transcriptional regulator [Alphaproteobacteria bacterium]|nr:helix-turn-helix transcriptional regulator [Alphaproteobacteria bacterium]MDE2495695.1 helix-turn-helix transcriptional regulator [Alphaproteobacteria bacterium]
MESRRLIAYNLMRIRLSRSLSQEALALSSGVDRTYVSGLERGLRNPSVDILDRLAKKLSIKTSELFADMPRDTKLTPLPRGRKPKIKK